MATFIRPAENDALHMSFAYVFTAFLVGTIVVSLSFPALQFAAYEWDRRDFPADGERRRPRKLIRPDLAESLFTGACCAPTVAFVACVWLACWMHLWPKAQCPVPAAACCISLPGCIGLCIVGANLSAVGKMGRHEVISLIIIASIAMAAAAAFGFLTTLMARWLNRRLAAQ
jgi:hypothetical protein